MEGRITEHGFIFGQSEIVRCCHDEKKGWIVLLVKTKKHPNGLQIYITKTGKIRVWNGAIEWKPANEQAAMQAEDADLRKQVAYQQEITARQKLALAAIFAACGYVDDGSCQTVQIYQDDATKDWIFTAGKKTIFASSRSELMDKVVDDFTSELGEKNE